MSKWTGLSLGALAVAVAAGGGYWLGSSKNLTGEASAPPAAPATGGPAKKERKLLYYRNPMGLPDISPVPKKDPMGMDYLPVYEGETEEDHEPPAARQIKISVEKVQKLGVRTEAAQWRTLDKVVRATGRVEADERRLFAITPKFEGYVERLHANVTGQAVSKGQALFEVYSPELVSAQREHAIALQGVESLKAADGASREGMRQLAESTLRRLRNWDISEDQLKVLSRSTEPRRTLTFRSPVSGIITEKKAVQGMRFLPGETLYQVADLSAVWVIADVFEQDIGQIKTGSKAKVRIDAYPGKTFEGTITYIYPTLKAETRTLPVRIELPNPELRLKPAMFAQVELSVPPRGKGVTVPTSAVIDSGTRRIVLVHKAEGRFEPREVKLGQRDENNVEVLEGIHSGELVVVAANFLIDAESNLQAAIDSFTQSGQKGETRKPALVGHKAKGRFEAFDPESLTITLTHEPVASLNWPGMTMDFQLTTPALSNGLKPGMPVSFEFIERKPGEWVVTALQPLVPDKPEAAGQAHVGH